MRFGHATWPMLLIFIVLAWAPQNSALAVDVSDAAQLIDAINNANTAGSGTITLTANIDLGGANNNTNGNNGLPSITGTITINGGGFTINRTAAVNLRHFHVSTMGNLTLNSVTLTNGFVNLAGGSIHNLGTLTVNNSTFEDNGTNNSGGAIFSSGTLTVNGSTFKSNQAGAFGGAIRSDGGNQLTVNSSTFEGNATNSQGGGAISIQNNTLETVVTGSTFSNNQAGNNGGAIVHRDGTMMVGGSTFTSNFATNGGGAIRNWNSGTATVANSSFIYNSAGNDVGNTGGGAIRNDAIMTIINSLFVSNEQLDGNGGAVHNTDTLDIINSTFANNTADAGTGLSVYSRLGTANVRNSILWNSPPPSMLQVASGATAVVTVTHSIVNGGLAGMGNLDSDPLFADPVAGNYRLQDGSPAINAGDNASYPGTAPTTDLDGNPRIFNSIIDMGAYENQTAPPEATPEPTPEATPEPTPDVDEPEQPGQTVAPTAPPVPLCTEVGGNPISIVRADVPAGTITGGQVYCRVIAEEGQFVRNPAEVGNQAVVDQGVFHAVDIFGLLPGGQPVVQFNHTVNVCLRGVGNVIFLDARQSPRVPQLLPTTAIGGFSCTAIPSAGTVVLVLSEDTQPVTAPDVQPSGEVLSPSCRGTTTDIVNLRSEPTISSEVIRLVPFDTSLQVVESVPGWYRVIHMDSQGWISADFFILDAGCNR